MPRKEYIISKIKGDINLTNNERILKLLRSEALTSKKVAKKLSLSEQDTRTYISRLKNKDKIKTIGKKGRYYVYTYKTPDNSENNHAFLNTLEYDLSYLLKLIEKKMTLKKGKELSQTDMTIIRRIKDRNSNNKEDIKRGVEILNEYVNFEQRFRNEINVKIAKLESRINSITPKRKLNKVKGFQYNDELKNFQELELEGDIQLHEVLDSDFILLFVDPKRYRVWIWQGNNATTRMKFMSAKIAPSIRDLYGIAFKITSVDEGSETNGFKAMIGLQEEVGYYEKQAELDYEGTKDDLELLESLSKEKILLLLEKTSVPEGYERKMVIVNNQLFEYEEYDRNYLGSVIKENKIFSLKEVVENGTYLAENYISRLVLSSNKIVLIELLQKIED